MQPPEHTRSTPNCWFDRKFKSLLLPDKLLWQRNLNLEKLASTGPRGAYSQKLHSKDLTDIFDKATCYGSATVSKTTWKLTKAPEHSHQQQPHCHWSPQNQSSTILGRVPLTLQPTSNGAFSSCIFLCDYLASNWSHTETTCTNAID